MLFGETVAVYCEKDTEHTNTCVDRTLSLCMLQQASFLYDALERVLRSESLCVCLLLVVWVFTWASLHQIIEPSGLHSLITVSSLTLQA
jgi:hypothetical protein